ncbi:MAG: trypsin-like peptidase domain-containing protein [Clostridia bacterium]|nr:trypsin-like peptidase domain-containing protein [Clostridia bacterium]
MSNYIYNNDFNYRAPMEDEEPKESRSKITILLVVSALLSLISGILGLIIGASLMDNEEAPFVPNTVYTNTVVKSPVNSQEILTSNGGADITRADVIAAVKDTVVEIKTQNVVHSFYQSVSEGAGSGVIVGSYSTDTGKKGYYIITNAHVVEGSNSNETADEITVVLTDGTEYEATVFGYDPVGDIAILTIEEYFKELKVAHFISSSSSVRVGDEVIAIGNPLGELGGTVTNGYVSALDREINVDGRVMNLMQTDAAINPGNSGGGLFNLKGELIGIVNAKSSGTGIEGLGFAIPADDAYKILTDFINEGYVTGRPTLGITCVQNGQYVQVASVKDGYNDDIFKTGDKVLYVRTPGQTSWTTVSTETLSNLVNQMEIGDKLEVCISRNNRQQILEAEIFEYRP